jgi:hypothetical protein
MKVKIEYTLEVDAEGWAKEYGFDDPSGEDAKEWTSVIREDVKIYFASSAVIPQHLEGIVKMK